MKAIRYVILIDDDPMNNFIVEQTIRIVQPAVIVKSFEDGAIALEYIKQVVPPSETVIFLDLNLPGISGWKFLDEFMQLEKSKICMYAIYMLSSSVAAADREEALKHPVVKGYFSKPLSVSTLQKILN